MSALLRNLFYASLVAGGVTLVLAAARGPLRRRVSARCRCWLWLVLALRLLLPWQPSLPGTAPLVQIPLPAAISAAAASPSGASAATASQSAPAQQSAATASQSAPTQQPAAESAASAPETAAAQPVFAADAQTPAAQSAPAAQQQSAPAPQTAGQPQTGTQTGKTGTGLRSAAAALLARLPRTAAFWLRIASYLWLTVAAALLASEFYGYFVSRRRLLRGAKENAPLKYKMHVACEALGVRREIPIYTCPGADSPMLVGLLRPVVLVPDGDCDGAVLAMALMHELAHYKRGDIAYKLLLQAVRCLHWFNPAIWLMADLAGQDAEFACDEAVVRGRDRSFRETYSQSILHVLRRSHARAACSARFGQGGAAWFKARIGQIFDFRKKRLGPAALALVLAVSIFAGSLVSCVSPASSLSGAANAAAPRLPRVTKLADTTILTCSNGVLVAYQNGTVNYLDVSGEVLCAAAGGARLPKESQYNELADSSFQPGNSENPGGYFVSLTADGSHTVLCGLRDSTGAEVLPARYSEVLLMGHDYIALPLDATNPDHLTLCDHSGKPVLTGFKNALLYQGVPGGNYFSIRADDGYYILNASLKPVLGPVPEPLQIWEDEKIPGNYIFKRTAVSDAGEIYGFYNESGKEIWPYGSVDTITELSDSKFFSDGRVSVVDGDKRGLIDQTGKVLFAPDGDWDAFLPYGMNFFAAVESKDGKWGYIDTSGKVVVPLVYDGAATDNMEGLVVQKKDAAGNTFSGLVNSINEEVLPCTQPGGLTPLTRYRFLLCSPGVSAILLDRSGAPLSAKYSNIERFADRETSYHFTRFRNHGPRVLRTLYRGYGMISIDGTELLKPEYDSVECYDSVCVAQKDGDAYLIRGWNYGEPIDPAALAAQQSVPVTPQKAAVLPDSETRFTAPDFLNKEQKQLFLTAAPKIDVLRCCGSSGTVIQANTAAQEIQSVVRAGSSCSYLLSDADWNDFAGTAEQFLTPHGLDQICGSDSANPRYTEIGGKLAGADADFSSMAVSVNRPDSYELLDQSGHSVTFSRTWYRALPREGESGEACAARASAGEYDLTCTARYTMVDTAAGWRIDSYADNILPLTGRLPKFTGAELARAKRQASLLTQQFADNCLTSRTLPTEARAPTAKERNAFLWELPLYHEDPLHPYAWIFRWEIDNGSLVAVADEKDVNHVMAQMFADGSWESDLLSQGKITQPLEIGYEPFLGCEPGGESFAVDPAEGVITVREFLIDTPAFEGVGRYGYYLFTYQLTTETDGSLSLQLHSLARDADQA